MHSELRSRTGYISKRSKRSLYFASIHSKLTCMAIMWVNFAKMKQSKLNILQNKAIKAQYNASSLHNTRQLYVIDDIQLIEHMVPSQLLMYIHRIKKRPPDQLPYYRKTKKHTMTILDTEQIFTSTE